ncbi:MAG: hypothetical protein AB1664_16590 [Thermodesulfobacteriota bacterium]
MPYPFELPFEQVLANLDEAVDAVFACLQSEFMVLPKGHGFVEYPVFETGYEALKRGTEGFTKVSMDKVLPVILNTPISLIVLRSILGFTPPEWAYVATRQKGIDVPQGFVRTLDRDIRLKPLKTLKASGLRLERLKALIEAGCKILQEGAPPVEDGRIHRLHKADSLSGLQSLQGVSSLGVPYAMLLYERFLGRPFAGHRDSVSELVGDVLETAIESALCKAGITYRKTKRAEKIANFDQTPDFIIPNEFNPKVVIEAKITEDDGTARDKVTRVQHLGELAAPASPGGAPKFEVIACIAGRGFGVRREDMKKLLAATRGKVFTLQNLDRLVECSQLGLFVTRRL